MVAQTKSFALFFVSLVLLWLLQFLSVLPSLRLCRSYADGIACLVKNDKSRHSLISMNVVPEILFVVMGEARYFSRWYEYLAKANASIVQVTFLYGSYDSPVGRNETKRCELSSQANEFMDCKLRYIPNSTWTEGRNLLAREGLILEKANGRKFDFWVFSDDDTDVHCPEYYDAIGKRRCWQELVESIGRARDMSSKITTIAPAYFTMGKEDGWVGVSTQDAIFAAFRREFVPYFLPYALPPPGLSEWLSQAALFCVMMTCFQSSVILPPNYVAINRLHRNYSKASYNKETIMETIRSNYGNFVNFEHCWGMVFKEGQDKIGPFRTQRELVEHIPNHNLGHCSALSRRFSEWEEAIINSTGE